MSINASLELFLQRILFHKEKIFNDYLVLSMYQALF